MRWRRRTTPGDVRFELAVLLAEQLNAFHVSLPFSVQPLVLLWVGVFLMAHQMLGRKEKLWR